MVKGIHIINKINIYITKKKIVDINLMGKWFSNFTTFCPVQYSNYTESVIVLENFETIFRIYKCYKLQNIMLNKILDLRTYQTAKW